MNKLLSRLLIVACMLLVSTGGPLATVSAAQKGRSPIGFFDVMYNGEVAGEVTVNTATKTPIYVLIADGLTPEADYMFWYHDAAAEVVYLLGSGRTTKSSRLHMQGTFTGATLTGLRSGQFRVTERGLGSIEPGHAFIAAGRGHSVAVTCDGYVYAWGDNRSCELAQHEASYPIQYPVPVDVPADVVEVVSGNGHSLALTSDGHVYAWGRDDYFQVGVKPDLGRSSVCTAVQVPAGGIGITKLAAGHFHSLALKEDGSLWSWGAGEHGQLGIGEKVDKMLAPSQVHGPGNVGYLTDVVDVAAGEEHTLALKSDGTVYAWGAGGHGQLGIHTNDDHTVPYQVHGPGDEGFLTSITKVAAGANFSLALKSDGTLWAWGEGGHGQLGIHSDNDHTVPYQVHGPDNVGYLTDIVDVAAGQHHSLALKRDGTVYAWGGNFFGQLGIHSDNDHTVPYQVHGPDNVGYLFGIIEVEAGEYFSLALRNDGTVWAWGENDFGQLGINSNNNHTIPYQVHGPYNESYLSGIGPTCPPTDSP